MLIFLHIPQPTATPSRAATKVLGTMTGMIITRTTAMVMSTAMPATRVEATKIVTNMAARPPNMARTGMTIISMKDMDMAITKTVDTAMKTTSIVITGMAIISIMSTDMRVISTVITGMMNTNMGNMDKTITSTAITDMKTTNIAITDMTITNTAITDMMTTSTVDNMTITNMDMRVTTNTKVCNTNSMVSKNSLDPKLESATKHKVGMPAAYWGKKDKKVNTEATAVVKATVIVEATVDPMADTCKLLLAIKKI